MQSALRIAKFIALAYAGLIALVLLFFACVLVRKSMPYVFASDIEELATTGPYNSREMASEMCGIAVDYVGSAKTATPAEGLAKATVLSWRPLYPTKGDAEVRVSGIGFNRAANRATGPCEATMRFRYRFAWVDNGRAVVLESGFVGLPVIAQR